MELYKIVYSPERNSFGLVTLKPEQRDYSSNVEGYDHPFINFDAAKDCAIADTRALDNGNMVVKQCPNCGKYFVFKKTEWMWYYERGWEPPKRCRKCRIAKRNHVDILGGGNEK